MKGTEKIVDRIIAVAKEEAEKIMTETADVCVGIKTEYEESAKKAYTEKVRSGVAECEEIIEKSERMSRMEANRNVLALKQEMVKAAFLRAEEKICTLPRGEYISFLAKLASKASVSGNEELIFAKRDAELAPAVIEAANALNAQAGKTAALKASAANGDFSGGVILRESGVDLNCTVSAMLEQYKNEISPLVAGKLFNE